MPAAPALFIIMKKKKKNKTAERAGGWGKTPQQAKKGNQTKKPT